jgi:hypothetical protein
MHHAPSLLSTATDAQNLSSQKPMSVPTSNSMKTPMDKSTAVYLMELRRRVAETKSPRRKLEVVSWTRPELDVIPIRKRFARPVPKVSAEAVVSGT